MKNLKTLGIALGAAALVLLLAGGVSGCTSCPEGEYFNLARFGCVPDGQGSF
ncbi:MAG: hypothetical protein ACR2PJ_00680 [Pseudomonadales bacterium]